MKFLKHHTLISSDFIVGFLLVRIARRAKQHILGKQCDLIMGNSRGASDIAWENSPHSPRRDLDEGVSVEMVYVSSAVAYPFSRARYPFPEGHSLVYTASVDSYLDGESIG